MFQFTNFRIGARLGGAFFLLIALLIATVLTAKVGLANVAGDIRIVVNDRYPKVQDANDILDELSRQARAQGYLVFLEAPKDREAQLAAMVESRGKAQALYEKLEKSVGSDKGRALLQTALNERQQYAGHFEEFMTRARATDLVGSRTVLLEKLRPQQLRYEQALNELIEFQEQLMVDDGKSAESDAAQASWIILAAAGLAVLMAAGAGVVVTRSITRPMDEAVRMLDAVSRGDLTMRVDGRRKDEIGDLQRAVEQLRTSLGRTVGSVRVNAESVASASSQIALGNQDLSQRTEEQASALQQTSATMTELSQTVRHNADNAQQADQLARGASEAAARGGQVVGQVVDTMKAINDSSRRIADIIGTIDGIAFQTNILALNAAVEAARAGEQGRGFAVVAGEVRSLAGRSAEAAREIKTLITRSVEQVEQGSTLVDQAGQRMEDIVAAIGRVSDIVGEISSASSEQSKGVNQVGDAVTQMDQVTQQNAALVEESAAAAESLKQQARQLVEAVAVFKLVDEAARPAGTSLAAHAAAPSRPATPAPKPAARAAARPAPATPPAAVASAPAAAPRARTETAAATTADEAEWTTF
ncbi:MAG: MCP four helix bundle domain-containing protein [Rubrivivax sp.]|nr:MCP four helix bundle domain-containing protein [Rubrivivax sp.]